MSLDLNQFSPMPIGKFKGVPVGDIAKTEQGYMSWFQINTIYDIIDFEAITGLQKPAKTADAEYKRANYSQTPTQYQANTAPPRNGVAPAPVVQPAWTPQGSTAPQQRVAYTPPKPQVMKVSSMMKTSVPDDYLELERQDFVFLIHVLSKSYKSKFNRSLLEDSLRIDPRTPEEIEAEAIARLSPAAQDIRKTLGANEEDDLPF